MLRIMIAILVLALVLVLVVAEYRKGFCDGLRAAERALDEVFEEMIQDYETRNDKED